MQLGYHRGGGWGKDHLFTIQLCIAPPDNSHVQRGYHPGRVGVRITFHHTVYLSITPQIIPTWNGVIMREMWGYGSPLVIQCNYLLLFPTKPIGQTVLRTITAADRERPCVEPLQLSTREGWYINCLGSSLVVCLIPLK